MKKIFIYKILTSVFIIIVVLNSKAIPADLTINKINSVSLPANLNYWEITEDRAPIDVLNIPQDSLWHKLTPIVNNKSIDEGNWLLRTRVYVGKNVTLGNSVLGIFPRGFITAFEIYWDTVLIAQNGVLGYNLSDEKAGSLNFNLPLPPGLLKTGEHVIIIRISNHSSFSKWKWYYGDLAIGSYTLGLKNIFQTGYLSFLITGILVIPFLFNLFLYIYRKRKTENLLFSLVCLLVILDYVIYQAPTFIKIPTTYIHFEFYSYYTITILYGILLPAYFIYLFSFPKKLILAVAIIILSVFQFFTNMFDIFNVMNTTALIIISMIAIWALIKRREGSIIIISGILLAWVLFGLGYGFSGLATILVLCTSFSIARQFAKNEKSEREALLRSTRLENELLRKNISPHFLLNTLTSIIVWLRKDPQAAITLIEALADEFRMILQVSDLKLITVKQELDLCRIHLKVMNFRKGGNYRIEQIDIEDEDKIPPMMFHTIIENGLSHGYENKLDGVFTLKRERFTDRVRYILSNDGDFLGRATSKSTGFGQRYIESRLEESFPGRWKYLSQKSETGWENIIEIKDV